MSVPELLAIAVAALGGTRRRGQQEMAAAVAHAFETGEHLVVQAGTGTGKSLAYLVPAIIRALCDDAPVVVSTATIALQRQLVDRDLPQLVDSLTNALPRRPKFALLKGRRNYLCLNKIHNSVTASDHDDERPQEELFDPVAVTALGRDVQRLTAWASTTVSGDRDDLKPGVGDRSWSQVSVSARECLGVARCPFGSECFSERARGAAGLADVVVTNHALLAIDAVAESAVLPEHRLLVVDEAHELADRVTSVAAAELTSATLGMAARRITRLVDPKVTQRLQAASATFSSAIHDARPGRIDCLDDEMATYLSALRDAASAARSAIDTGSDTTTASVRAEAGAVLTEISDTASRILASFAPAIPDRSDVVWLEHEDNHESARAVLRVAPLSVAELLATQVFARATTVLTSATLTIGGSFDAMATAWGLTADTPWRGLDVGSPFQHAKSGILYVAAHLPPPGRDGSGSAEQLTEIAELITAAGGRTLGPVLVHAGRPGSHRGHARTAVHAGVVSGRRQYVHAGGEVHRRCGDLPVRHAVAVAGGRRAGTVAVVGVDRPHPVPPAGRSPAECPPACGGRPWRQRLHDGRRQPRGAAAGTGIRPAVTARHRSGRGCGARFTDGYRPLWRIPASLAAALLADHQRHASARGPAAPCASRRKSPLNRPDLGAFASSRRVRPG